MKLFFILSLIININSCFISNPTILNNKKLITSKKNKYLNKDILGKNRLLMPIKANQNSCPENLLEFLTPIKINHGEKIVKSITEFLPTADGIAPHVLHANEYMINVLLNNDNIPMHIKKELILNVIKISLFGDSVGSHMLHMYYDLVKCLL